MSVSLAGGTAGHLALLVVALMGYAVSFPVLLWHRRDLRSFPTPVWTGCGRRSSRLAGALVCYLAVGWPELFMAWGWRSSVTRKALIFERENFSGSR